MIKGKTITLISGSSGKPKYLVAKRVCKCSKCGSVIYAGQKCVDIPKLGAAYTNWKRYCLSCFKLVIKQTALDLEILRSELEED